MGRYLWSRSGEALSSEILGRLAPQSRVPWISPLKMLVGLEDLTQPMVKLNDFVGGKICISARKDQVLWLSKRCVSWFLAGVFFFFVCVG